MAKMVTFLITSFFILAFLAIAVYFWQKPTSLIEAERLPPPSGRGLFIDRAPDDQDMAEARAQADLEATEQAARQRAELLQRAKAGEKSTLQEARYAEDSDLYNETLNLLVADADSDPKLLALISYVTRHELGVNDKLAGRVIDAYKNAPDRSATAKMLHIAALSDDAAVFQRAVETTLEFWRKGQLPEVSAPELRSILEGEFWILSSPTRSSGAGFVLKRTLANARRELDAAHND